MCAMCTWTDEGRLFTWGDGANGKLGHGDQNEVLEPKEVEGGLKGRKVVGASAGGSHSMAWTGEVGIAAAGGSTVR